MLGLERKNVLKESMPTFEPNELAVLLEGAGFSPIPDRAFLRVTGTDATRWLNGMVSNSIQALQPGEGNYNFLLNAQGRIQGDAMIYRDPAEGEITFLVETETSQRETIQQALDRFIIMDDVEIAPVEGLSGVLVAGPQALAVVMALGTGNQQAAPCSPGAQAPAPHAVSLKHTSYGSAPVWLIQAFSVLVPRFEIWADPATAANILSELGGSGAVPVSEEALESLRLLEARPRYGVDIRDRDLPQETAQTQALHFSKGCYLGQEIVERIRSRGQVHRRFTAFRLTGELPETLPAPLVAAGKPAGEITSAALVSLAEGPALVALGYVRQEAVEAKLELAYAGGVAVPQRDPRAAG
jgi:folate-binding protein YgfZ